MAASTLEAAPAAESVRRLLEIAQAQAAAIGSWDLDGFQALLDERAELQSVIEQLGEATSGPRSSACWSRLPKSIAQTSAASPA